jgi:uncharacterized membrane protein
MPSSLAELQNYKAIIFDNVPSYSLTNIQMQMIEKYVHDLGGGFLMIGGVNSFGVGGYYDTPIEKLMPVKMIPEKKKRSVSIDLLIDRSGSMNALSGGTSKIELAKEAAISITEILTDKDKIGVIAFDAEAEGIVKLQGIQDKSQIIEKIGKIRARGGTNFYPALNIANEWLKVSDTQLKHVIIVSDGQSLQMDLSLDLVKQMAQKNITISTISISDEADKKAMQEMANLGSGRYYETTDASNLPNILIKEALMSSDLIIEGVFRPIMTTDSEIFSGINTKAFPVLFGYIQTSSKKGSDALLISDHGDPILSTWQYGLGRAIAFTSDSLPKWSLEWLKWSDFGKFWSQTLEWCLPSISDDFDISTTFSGNKTTLAVDAVDSSGKFRNFLNLQTKIVKPDLTSEDVSLNQTGIGRYECEFDASQMGTYMLSVAEIINDNPQKWRNISFIVSYSPEYTDLESNTKWLHELANITDGKYDPSYKDVFGNREQYIWRTTNLWKWFLILAKPLFFLDIAIRRITVSYEQIAELWQKLDPLKEINEQRIIMTERLKTRKEIATISQTQLKSYEIKHTQKLDTPQIPYTSKLLEAKKRAESIR